MERLLENMMYSARWILAPIYFGLSFALLALAVKFFQELIHLAPHLLETAEADLILVVLSLVDMALVGGLLVMVMISGYENFVSQLDIDEGKEKLSWLGKMDSGSLKMKVAASRARKLTEDAARAFAMSSRTASCADWLRLLLC